MNDSIRIIQPKIRIETPIGAIESDSGNHAMDAVTVIFFLLILYIGKKVIDKYFRRKI